MLGTIVEYVRDQAAATGQSAGMPGYLAGVYHGGNQVVVASGMANVATGALMTEDTQGFSQARSPRS